MKSELKKHEEKIFKKDFSALLGENTINEMDKIIKFVTGKEEINKQILEEATITAKTINPDINNEDLTVAVTMIYGTVCNALYSLLEEVKKV